MLHGQTTMTDIEIHEAHANKRLAKPHSFKLAFCYIRQVSVRVSIDLIVRQCLIHVDVHMVSGLHRYVCSSIPIVT